ncbi:uncharacterized protein LOC124460648 [Drosophila willistoni]|uniref:uncharacterized protein LOC124460648 n=1 Tax=Drosophila willistoni TaxID=7260 RepID=UPI001F07E751|nr:uncharacterized protein LOC124460648 [Drosophila willistoni]
MSHNITNEACQAHVTFTNLKCHNYFKNLGDFETCSIKAVNRTHKYINIYYKTTGTPIDNVTVNFKLMRYDHGYKPFYLDLTYDACQFLKLQKNPIAKIMYATFKDSSNMNHTCPYNQDVFINKLWTGNLETGFTRILPMPLGDYAIFTNWYTNNIIRCYVNTYFRLTDKK